MKECTKSGPSNRPTGNKIPNVIHTRSLMSKQKSLVPIAYIPRREQSLISKEGGHPSAISLSLSACPSRNAQWCQTLIKCWHLTFRTETCTLFSLPKSVYCPAETLWLQIQTPFWCLAPISDSWRIVLEPCWKNKMWKSAETIHRKSQKHHVKTLVPQPASLQFYSHKCAAEVLLETAP